VSAVTQVYCDKTAEAMTMEYCVTNFCLPFCVLESNKSELADNDVKRNCFSRGLKLARVSYAGEHIASAEREVMTGV